VTSTPKGYDAVIVGAGPNGLAAAIVLGQAGLSTLVVEANRAAGGGMRSSEVTLPGFVHDVCSTVHPLGAASPLFRLLGLERHGVEWVHSPSVLAHVLEDGTTVTMERSVAETAEQLGLDAGAYRRLLEPLTERFDTLIDTALGPLRLPRAPVFYGRFGLSALRSMTGLAQSHFSARAAPALLGGIAAHAMLPLDGVATASFALVLGSAGHAVGWPIVRGGSCAIAGALVARLRDVGGELWLDHFVESLDELPPARAYVLDVTPRQLLRLAGDVLPESYCERMQRFRYGPGVCKVDWALREPVPWKDARCARAATVHLSGSLEDVARAEAAVHAGGIGDPPFVLFVQPTLFDASRAPAGTHVAWAYCHVPHASAVDASDAIEAHVERFAPGFRDVILARSVKTAPDMERYNPNYVGGDINGGSSDIGQLFFRPLASRDPYATPAPHVFLCSSSTPPGGGVHGMCGYWAARSVLSRVFGRRAAAAA
jgi:phytoene dehydrogenase-like protein